MNNRINIIETFANPSKGRDYVIHMEIPEFTSLCPKTSQPDFGKFVLDYVPYKKCIELKSLKLYMTSYRDFGAFHEDLTNKILEDFVKKIDPLYIRLISKFNVRGGIFTNVIVENIRKNWKLPKNFSLEKFGESKSTL